MKRGLFLLATLFFMTVVYFAVSDESKLGLIMNEGDNITLGGRNIKFLYAANTTAVFRVDGFNVLTYYNITKNFYGVRFLVKDIYGINIVLVDITAYQICGNNKCENDEYCCKDCGCQQGYGCVNNICIVKANGTCIQDSDCDDTNPCTIDKCSGYAGNCTNMQIELCKSDDLCCPKLCNENNDADCRKCPINDCYVNNTCMKEGSIFNNSYCLGSSLKLLKSFNEPCSNDFECSSGKCINKICSESGETTNQTKVNIPKIKFDFLKDRNTKVILFIIGIVIALVYIRFEITRKKMTEELLSKRGKGKSNGDRGI